MNDHIKLQTDDVVISYQDDPLTYVDSEVRRARERTINALRTPEVQGMYAEALGIKLENELLLEITADLINAFALGADSAFIEMRTPKIIKMRIMDDFPENINIGMDDTINELIFVFGAKGLDTLVREILNNLTSGQQYKWDVTSLKTNSTFRYIFDRGIELAIRLNASHSEDKSLMRKTKIYTAQIRNKLFPNKIAKIFYKS